MLMMLNSKTTVRYHLMLIRMATIKNLQTINVGEDVENRETLSLLVGMQTDTATMENSVWIPLKTGRRTAI